LGDRRLRDQQAVARDQVVKLRIVIDLSSF
jgi:hypothetical protein